MQVGGVGAGLGQGRVAAPGSSSGSCGLLRMSGKAPPGLEGRVRKTLQKVFGFESFKTSLQESATMAVARGEAGHERRVEHGGVSVCPSPSVRGDTAGAAVVLL